jgi:anti-sigma regulatory factor (Ser/Thr protein kinase)
MLLVNIMSFAETTVIGLFTLFAVRYIGSDAAWISNAVVDVLCILVVLLSVLCYTKQFDFSMPALLKLRDDFGAKPDECMTFSATCMDDVVAGSEQAIDFCLKHSYPKKVASHVGLCVEEMAANVLQHGFGKHSLYYADVRIVSSNSGLTVRIRDNCKEFDPRKRIEMFDPAHPEKNIGIRIVSNAARQIDYYNNAGINTLIMKF